MRWKVDDGDGTTPSASVERRRPDGWGITKSVGVNRPAESGLPRTDHGETAPGYANRPLIPARSVRPPHSGSPTQRAEKRTSFFRNPLELAAEKCPNGTGEDY